MAFKMNGFPTHRGTSMAQQRVTKGGEGQDQNKIFDAKGNHVGDYVDGKKVMLKKGMTKGISKLTTKEITASKSDKPMATIAKQAVTGPEIPHGQETITKGFTGDSDYEGIVNDKKNSRSYIRKYDLMSKEDKAKAKIRDTGQTMIKDSDRSLKNATKITLASGDKDVVFQ